MNKHGINFALVAALVLAFCQQPAEAKGKLSVLRKIVCAPISLCVKVSEKLCIGCLALCYYLQDQLEEDE